MSLSKMLPMPFKWDSSSMPTTRNFAVFKVLCISWNSHCYLIILSFLDYFSSSILSSISDEFFSLFSPLYCWHLPQIFKIWVNACFSVLFLTLQAALSVEFCLFAEFSLLSSTTILVSPSCLSVPSNTAEVTSLPLLGLSLSLLH